MLFRKKEELQILSHKNIFALNYLDRAKFLKIYFDELRTYLLPLDSFVAFKSVLTQFPILLMHFKNFWVALSHCSINTEDLENKKIYLNAEKNIFALYAAIADFRKKYHLQKIENLFHSLHLVMMECYPKDALPHLKFKLPNMHLHKNEEAFIFLKKMMTNPSQAIVDYQTKFCKKEFFSVFYLYQRNDFSDEATNAFRKDISAIARQYPYVEHEKILDDYYKKLGNSP